MLRTNCCALLSRRQSLCSQTFFTAVPHPVNECDNSAGNGWDPLQGLCTPYISIAFAHLWSSDHLCKVHYEILALFCDSQLGSQLVAPRKECASCWSKKSSFVVQLGTHQRGQKNGVRREGLQGCASYFNFFVKSDIRISSSCVIFYLCCRMFNRKMCGHRVTST